MFFIYISNEFMRQEKNVSRVDTISLPFFERESHCSLNQAIKYIESFSNEIF